MKHVEQAGLVKFDFLGLTTLTILQPRRENFLKAALALRSIWTDAAAGRQDAPSRCWPEGRCRRGVPDGRRRACATRCGRCVLTRFEDLIAAVALYRPGPMANIPDYCRRKHGEKWNAPHPSELHEILAETYGIMVYQEQVMQIAQTMAWLLASARADLLRRAMGKKIRRRDGGATKHLHRRRDQAWHRAAQKRPKSST